MKNQMMRLIKRRLVVIAEAVAMIDEIIYEEAN